MNRNHERKGYDQLFVELALFKAIAAFMTRQFIQYGRLQYGH